MKQKRKSGILLHIASLPNKYGIGSLGHEAFAFVDYLVKCGQTLWQILPLSPTGFGDSPYQSFSVFAGNPYFISLDTLADHSLLEQSEIDAVNWREDERCIDYGTLYNNSFTVLRKAFERFEKNETLRRRLDDYIEANKWVREYGLFMALKEANGGKPWSEWDEPFRNREPEALEKARKKLAKEIRFRQFLEQQFFEQWDELKSYAKDNGISIIGDMPIYCAYDSADVWCEPELFELDETKTPTVVAGFPPDGFSPDGQLWGNPIYNWAKMSEDGFHWWAARMSYAKSLYDIVRIDHFIGFERYFAIPYGGKAADGHWCKGPGWELFRELIRQTGSGGVLAEDLGIITPPVRRLLKQTGYPGMKVLQFAFDEYGRSDYLPQNYTSGNYAVYTSTHDSDTAAGWAASNPRAVNKLVREYLGLSRNSQIPRGFIKLAWQSTADIAMTTIQELCGYGSEARVNIPSTLGGNWRWRAVESDFSEENAEYLRRLTQLSNRSRV